MLVAAVVADILAELAAQAGAVEVVLVVLPQEQQGPQTLAAAVGLVDILLAHSLVLLAALVLSSLERYPQHLPQQDRLLSQLTLGLTSINSRDQGALRSNGTLCRT